MRRYNITPPVPPKEMRCNNESTDSSATDPMFLSWGSSVNICDELRRSIRFEVDEIDGSITTLQTNLKNEERSSAQLSKDVSLSRNEMFNICRGANDERENATVNEQIRIRMAETLNTELLTNVVSPLSSRGDTSYKNLSSEEENDADMSVSGEDMTGSASQAKKIPSLASQLSRYRIKLQQESKTISDEKKELQAVTANIDDIEDEIKRISHRIKDTDLPSQLKEVEREVESKRQQELESELQRKCSTKESIQRSRKRCGDFAQQIADKSKELSSEKVKNESMVKELKTRLKCREDEVKILQSSELSVQEENFISINNRLKQLTHDISEIEAINAKTIILLEEHKTISKEIENAESEEESVVQRLRDAEKSYAETTELMKKTRDQHNENLEKRRTNDLREENEKKAALSEKLQKFIEKEELAAQFAELHEKYTEIEAKLKQSRDEINASIKKEDYELDATRAELEKFQALKEREKEKLESDNNSARAEIAMINDVTSKMEEASKVERDRFDETLRHRKLELNSNLDHVKNERMLLTQVDRFKIETLKRGAALLENAEQIQKEAKVKAQQKMQMKNKLKELVSQNEVLPAVSIESTPITETCDVKSSNQTLVTPQEESKLLQHDAETHHKSLDADESQEKQTSTKLVTDNLTQNSVSLSQNSNTQSSKKSRASLSQNSNTQSPTKSRAKMSCKPSRRSNRKRS